MSKIAFIGLGNMGAPMAANLVKAGHSVAGFDLVDAAKTAAAGSGVAIAASAREAVASADTVVTMLPAGRHVLAAHAELLPATPKGALVIDCSTIDVDSARKAHEAGGVAGVLTLDAPVSGGVGGASGGTLTFMCGGSDEAFARAKPILENMGKRIVHCGGAGAGQAAKICNNMLLGISMLGVCEAFALAEKLGLDPLRFFEIASKSSGQCWSLTSYSPWPGPVPSAPSNRGYEGGFLTSLMSKDLKLAQEAAARVGAATPLGSEAQALYALFETLGYGQKDFSAVLQLMRGRLADL